MPASRLSTATSRLIVAASLASLVGCTSMHTIAERGAAPLSASQLGQLVARNDTLTITGIDGTSTRMQLHAVLPDAIEGAVDGSAQVTQVRLDQIRKIERRSFDGTKTTILVVVLVGGLYLLIEAASASTAAGFIG